MAEKILYSYTGLFDTPDEIIHAAEKTADKGYTKYDVNTPYPLHGMNTAMKLKPSKLGYVALAVGLTGALAAVMMMYWMMAVDYPIIIGGKPFFAFPAFVPIIFEVTVLSASVATVVTMLFVFFKLPNNSHPLHGTEYMRQVSSDKYGISIQADDPKFNSAKVESFLKELGAKEIAHVFYDNEEITTRYKILEPKFLVLLAAVALITSGSTYFMLNKLMFITPFNWMMEQSKIIPQVTSSVFIDEHGMRNPVEGTVARGYLPYPYSIEQQEIAETNLSNPLLMTKENLELGKKKFDTYCSPCHGYYGEGDSRLRGQFPNPPNLHSEKVRNWGDGRIFHIITEGQNVMPSYSSQMSREERWATVLYIRALQRAKNAKESDLK